MDKLMKDNKTPDRCIICEVELTTSTIIYSTIGHICSNCQREIFKIHNIKLGLEKYNSSFSYLIKVEESKESL